MSAELNHAHIIAFIHACAMRWPAFDRVNPCVNGEHCINSQELGTFPATPGSVVHLWKGCLLVNRSATSFCLSLYKSYTGTLKADQLTLRLSSMSWVYHTRSVYRPTQAPKIVGEFWSELALQFPAHTAQQTG